MKKSSNSSKEEGNTNPSSLHSSTQKQVSPAIAWCFTLNNYTENDIKKFQDIILEKCRVGFFNKEVGASGTPHLQGYIEFKTKGRPIQVFGVKETHWEKARGCKDSNFKYCSKECSQGIPMTFEHGIIRKTPLRVISVLKPWQASVKEIIDEEHSRFDTRTINWLVDTEGCCGKTVFCKYLHTVEKQLMIITGGGYKDIACALKLQAENPNWDLNNRTTILFNIPRQADDEGMISYKALESLKDGLITSTKYESGTMVFNSPVVWVFSNNEPEYKNLSKDRWVLWEICAEQLIKCEKRFE